MKTACITRPDHSGMTMRQHTLRPVIALLVAGFALSGCTGRIGEDACFSCAEEKTAIESTTNAKAAQGRTASGKTPGEPAASVRTTSPKGATPAG
ncbi:hypothetical protein [Komagataeibacter sp. FNDCR2]|uniref:hypothetical protein n=1 Tax=Komagataeibacter sp. FNDCR2 TaxID=2878682 RepID=UPI001E3C10C4|nr:hypothetical protein [Komagataeibacter sp. FNDCR2]MCE2574362.1 hypothetical protein [Komagataeibacter sp. FNDCR2]